MAQLNMMVRKNSKGEQSTINCTLYITQLCTTVVCVVVFVQPLSHTKMFKELKSFFGINLHQK